MRIFFTLRAFHSSYQHNLNMIFDYSLNFWSTGSCTYVAVRTATLLRIIIVKFLISRSSSLLFTHISYNPHVSCDVSKYLGCWYMFSLQWQEMKYAAQGKFSILLLWTLIVARSILFRAHLLGLLLLFIVPPSNASGNTKITNTVFEWRDVFPSILCEECERFPTQHWCLFDVTKHGYLFDGCQVCGTAVCSICASSFGHEGIFTCVEH